MADEPEVTSADDLFLVPPDRFTAARNALAKALKANDKAAAAAIAKRKRPSATAWALNVVAHDEPAVIEGLLAAADELKAALASGEGDAVREAQREQRSRLEQVVQVATRLLAEHGQSTAAANDQRLRSTLQAAVVDDDVADTLRAAHLERDFEASGFGFAGTTATPLVRAKPTARTAEAATAEPDEPTVTVEAGEPPAPSDRERRRADEEARRRRLALERYERLVATAEQLEAEAAARADEAAEAAAALAEAEGRAREARRAAEHAADRASTARAKADEARPDE